MIKLILLQNFCYVFWFPPSYQTKVSRVQTSANQWANQKKASLEGILSDQRQTSATILGTNLDIWMAQMSMNFAPVSSFNLPLSIAQKTIKSKPVRSQNVSWPEPPPFGRPKVHYFVGQKFAHFKLKRCHSEAHTSAISKSATLRSICPPVWNSKVCQFEVRENFHILKIQWN